MTKMIEWWVLKKLIFCKPCSIDEISKASTMTTMKSFKKIKFASIIN